MNIGRIKLVKIFLACMILCVSNFCWLRVSYNSCVFAQTDSVNNNSGKSTSRGKNINESEKPIVIEPVNAKKTDPDQENISREAMALIMEITKTNILYEKNKSSANLAFQEQKFKDREKQNKEMKKYNETYNKKYLASLKRFQKMRGQHAGYSGIHSDYSAYLEQFLVTSSR